MRKILVALVSLIVALAGCGSERTFGQAAEEWCHAHYSKPVAAELRCFKVVIGHGPKFLRAIERGEQIESEIVQLRAMRP